MKNIFDMIDELKNPDYEYKMLQFGKLVEKEHVNSFTNMDADTVSTMIAKDHIKADPMYYIKLYQAGLIDEPDAIKYYTDIIVPLDFEHRTGRR